MIPVNDLRGIESKVRRDGHQRAIFLLLVKPSDTNAEEFISNFNYYHHDSGNACSIFAAGYGEGDFSSIYNDAREVSDVNGQRWWYSDKCFVGFKNELEKRISWRYCGEPQILILQTSRGKHSGFDFSNYVAIDACQGIRQGYIDSIPRLMEALISASKQEVEAKKVLKEARKLSPAEISKTAIELALELSRCPEPIKKVLKDRAFYRSANHRNK